MSEPTSEPAPTPGPANPPDEPATTASAPPVAPPTYVPASVPVTAGSDTASLPVVLPAAPVAEPPRRGRAARVLGALVVVMVLVTGALGVLFVTYTHDADAKLAAQQTQIADLESKVAARKTTLASHDSELNTVRLAAVGAKQKADAREACPPAVQTFVNKIRTSGQAPSTDDVLVLVRACGVTL
jgi:hypothetical protein